MADPVPGSDLENRPEQQPLVDPPTETISRREAITTIFWAALPFAITYFVNNLCRMVTFNYLKGYDNDVITSAYGIGNIFVTLVGIAIYVSLNVGMITKISPAFGARNYKLIGYYFHRALIINIIVSIVLALLLVYSDVLFTLLNYQVQLAEDTRNYLCWCIPGLFFFMLFSTCNFYLIGIFKFRPPAYMQIAAAPLYLIFAYIFVVNHGMGLQGAAIAYLIMNAAAFAMMVGYLYYENPNPESMFWPDRISFKNLWGQFKHEINVGSMIFVEWVGVEFMGIMSGELGENATAAYTATLASIIISYNMTISMGNCMMSFMGRSIGENRTDNARRYLEAVLIIDIAAAAIAVAFYMVFRSMLANFLLDNPQAIQLSIMIFGLYMLFLPFDFIQMSLGGGLRALGKETEGSIVVCTCMYGIGIPTAFILAFELNMGLRGLIYGLGAAFLSQFFIYAYLYYNLDWEKQAMLVNAKIGSDSDAAGVSSFKKKNKESSSESGNSEKDTGLGIVSDEGDGEGIGGDEIDSLTKNST